MSPGVRSGAFGPFPCAMEIVGCVRSISVRPKVRSGAFGPFTRALGVVGFVRVRLVRSGAFGPFPLRPGGRRVRSVQFRTP